MTAVFVPSSITEVAKVKQVAHNKILEHRGDRELRHHNRSTAKWAVTTANHRA